MSPPQLARDAPVLDVLQPVLIGVLVFRGVELDFVVHHGWQGNVGKMFHAEEPLQRQTGLDGCVGVTLGIAHLVGVLFHTLHQTCLFKVAGYLFAAGKTVHAHIEGRLSRDGAVGIEDVDALEVVRLAEHVVVGVVGGSDLQTTCAKLYFDIAVFDDLYLASYQRHDDVVPLEPLVLRVFGVDTHGCVAHDGFRTCCGYNGVIALLVFVDDVAFFLKLLFIVKLLKV